MAKKKETKGTNTIIKSENKESEFVTRDTQSFEVQNVHLKQQAIENPCRSTLHWQHRLPYRSLIERPRQEVLFFQQDGDDCKGALGEYRIKSSVTGSSLL